MYFFFVFVHSISYIIVFIRVYCIFALDSILNSYKLKMLLHSI